MIPFLLAMMSLIAGASAADAPDELLVNPGFNEDADADGLPDGWSTSASSIRYRERVFMGKDYELISRPGTYVLATQDIQLEKGQQYTLKITCRGEDGAIAGALIVHGEDRPTREMPLLWNVNVTDEYEEYVTTFQAPNPVARLFIYNLAKTKGVVYYDHVSLRKGEPDSPVIGDISLKPIDQPLSEPLETEHIDWASPLAGGPVTAFITLRNFRCLRQVVELQQRMDLDCDIVHTGYDGTECASLTGRRAMKRVEAGQYDVYIVPSRVNKAVAKAIRERVEAGAGLVLIEGFGRTSEMLDGQSLEEVADDHYVRAGVPWELMPEKILGGIQTGQMGKGRVVRLQFPLDISRVWGLIPSENSCEAWSGRQFVYWEWWESLLAKATAWAAGRDVQATARVKSVSAGEMQVQVDAPAAVQSARVIVRSAREIRFDGPMLRAAPEVLKLDQDRCLRAPIPASFPKGIIIADLALLDAQEQVVSWLSVAGETDQAVTVDSLETDSATYVPEGLVTASLDLQAPAEREVTVLAQLIDAFGRVVSQTSDTRVVEAGVTAWPVELTVRQPLCVLHRVFVQAIVDGREQDSAWKTVLVPAVGPARAGSDFLTAPWGAGMSHPAISLQYVRMTRDLGLNGEFATRADIASESGLAVGGYMAVGDIFRESQFTADGVRTKCLSDPEVIAEYRDRAQSAASAQAPYGLYGVGIADESFLSSRHRRHELCFSEHCQSRYRDWLRDKYGDLDGLNASWDTDYTSWDEITGMRTEDVRQQTNYAPFVDFRTFMTDVWVEACRDITSAYHETLPDVPVGHTNTFGANPFNGNDYWKLCTRTGFGWGQEYSEAIKSTAHKAVFDLWRSFTPYAGEAPEPFANYGWIGYDHSEAAAHYEPWWLALHGSRGASYFATNSIDAARGISWSLVFPTLSYTPYSVAVRDALRDLAEGCGKLFMEYERERPEIAILWSHPSMLVSWCESDGDQPVPDERDGTDSYGSYFLSALNFRQHLNELQLDYDYVAPEQITGTDILARYRMLYLPFTVAASPELVRRLAEYVEAGGVLIGDLRCLRTDEHGKPFGNSDMLRQLFGVERSGGEPDYGRTKVALSGNAEGIGEDGLSLQVLGREQILAAGATALAQHETGEAAVFVMRRGEGLAVYLNFRLPAYDVGTRELIRQIVAKARVSRDVKVEGVGEGAPPRCYERNTFRRGPVTVHALIRDHRRCGDTDPVRVEFGQVRHVYDVRAREYLGNVDAVDASPAPGGTSVYALLPYRVEGVVISVAERVQAGGALNVSVRVVTSGAQLGDHIFRLELESPDGERVWHYRQNVVAPEGVGEVAIPIGYNEAPGRWKILARDVLSGTEATALFEVVGD